MDNRCSISSRNSFNSNKAYVVNQSKGGMFDEHKIMLGYPDIESAKSAYLKCYEKGWEKNIMSIVPTNTKRLREWLKTGVKTDPFAGDK